MKIIHTGDVHLCSAMRNLPPDKAKLRKTEILDTFRQLTIYARENGVQAVLIAGDLFDENTAQRQVKREVFSIIHEARSVCFFYVSGNHDSEFDFEDEVPENFYTFSQNHGWKSYDLPENVTVTGMDTKYLREGKFAELSLRHDRYNILLLHGETTACDMRGRESIPLQCLQNKHVDYLALGHIHIPTMTAERLDGRGHYRYCGCLEGRGFDECGQRGCFMMELRDGKLIGETFLSFSKRMVREVRADISACENYFDVERTALQALQGVSEKDIVKLVLCGRFKVGLKKDLPLLTHRLSEKFFFVKAEDESKIFIDYSAFSGDVSERGEFVREVGRYEMNEELRAEILDVGLKALAGEDIDL